MQQLPTTFVLHHSEDYMSAELHNITGSAAVESLIEYQSGSVVSRTILKKSTGTVTLFAFDTGEGLSEHTTQYEALITVVDGSTEITISGVKHIVSKGELIILPANEPHALHAPERFKMVLTMIKD